MLIWVGRNDSTVAIVVDYTLLRSFVVVFFVFGAALEDVSFDGADALPLDEVSVLAQLRLDVRRRRRRRPARLIVVAGERRGVDGRERDWRAVLAERRHRFVEHERRAGHHRFGILRRAEDLRRLLLRRHLPPVRLELLELARALREDAEDARPVLALAKLRNLDRERELVHVQPLVLELGDGEDHAAARHLWPREAAAAPRALEPPPLPLDVLRAVQAVDRPLLHLLLQPEEPRHALEPLLVRLHHPNLHVLRQQVVHRTRRTRRAKLLELHPSLLQVFEQLKVSLVRVKLLVRALHRVLQRPLPPRDDELQPRLLKLVRCSLVLVLLLLRDLVRAILGRLRPGVTTRTSRGTRRRRGIRETRARAFLAHGRLRIPPRSLLRVLPTLPGRAAARRSNHRAPTQPRRSVRDSGVRGRALRR
mmetsp:Transcript_1429/g.5265  ORF Transcript_1429/g.5265 Transcript_1429/m.5265 type:complete len:421 (-) Transcript_1429:116-1378(-)